MKTIEPIALWGLHPRRNRGSLRSFLRYVCLAIILGSFPGCMPLAIHRNLTRAYDQDEVLHWTVNLPTYRRFGRLSSHQEMPAGTAATKIHFVWRQPTSGLADTTFVLIHGYPASLFTWAGLIAPMTNSQGSDVEKLAEQANLLALDLPGHGFTKSRGPTRRSVEQVSPTNMATAVIGLLNARNVKGRVILVGHSFGALVALAAARQSAAVAPTEHPWQVAAMVLIDPEGAPRTAPEEFLKSERKLRFGLLGWLSGSHYLARHFGWIFSINQKAMWNYGYWHAEADASIREMTSNPDTGVPDDQRDAYAWLMRIPENYHSNRTLVRSTGKAQTELVGWAGHQFARTRSLIWGDSDRLFKRCRDEEFFKTYFRPHHKGIVLGVGHLITKGNPECIATALLDTLRGDELLE